MAPEKNPILKLTVSAYREDLSEDDCVQLASEGSFWKKIKKSRHYDDVIELVSFGCFDLPLRAWSYSIKIALQCGEKQKIRPHVMGRLNVLSGLINAYGGNIEEALDSLLVAKRLLVRSRCAEEAHLANTLIAFCHLLLGRPDTFKQMDLRLKRSFSKPESKKRIPGVYLLIAHTFLTMGESEKAFSYLQKAKKLAGNVNHKTLVAMGMGRYYSYTGQYERSLEQLDDAKRLEEKLDRQGWLALIEQQRGVLFRILGQYREAIQALESHIAFSQEMGHHFQIFNSETMLASLYLEDGNSAQALDILRGAQIWSESSGLNANVAECMLSQAWVYRKLRQFHDAISLIKSARDIFFQKKMDMEVANCDIAAAVISAERGDREIVLQIFDEVLEKYARLDPISTKLKCFYGKALCLQRMGKYEEARSNYDLGIEIIEGIRGNLISEGRRSSYLESKHEIYIDMIKCCLDAHAFEAALEYVERLKTRRLTEMLSTRDYMPKNATPEEIEEYKNLRSLIRICEYRISGEQDEKKLAELNRELTTMAERFNEVLNCIRLNDPEFDPYPTSTIRYDDIWKLIPDYKTAIIELFPMEERTVAFVALKNRNLCRAVFLDDYNQALLERDLEAIQRKDAVDSTLRELYDRLFLPLKPYLSEIKAIIFIPYSRLHLLPLHAMWTEENGQRNYVIDKYLVTYAPSAKVLNQCKSRGRSFERKVFVGSANPKRDIPYPEYEAQAVADLFGVEVNRKLTRSTLIDHGRGSQVFHYTGHANGKALRLEDMYGEEDLYESGDIFCSLDLPVSWLVTLSACDTGKIKIGKTDEYIGLPSAFLHAGAATVISSLWKVSDLSTTLLMGKMYGFIDDGHGKAESLWKAQLWLKNPENREEHLDRLTRHVPWISRQSKLADSTGCSRKPIYAEELLSEELYKPYYWAGFICTGAP